MNESIPFEFARTKFIKVLEKKKDILSGAFRNVTPHNWANVIKPSYLQIYLLAVAPAAACEVGAAPLLGMFD